VFCPVRSSSGSAEEELRAAVRDTSVYARVAPEHKLRIVDALQADGQIVAMTGDGVNDAPALKSADIGVAMGVTGTDVTKEAADMILADDNFATIVAAIREGRGIFANIRRFLRFLLSSNIGEVLTMFLGVVFAGVVGLDTGGEAVVIPLLAVQILWINLLTDTGPALAMGLDPPPDDVMEQPPRQADRPRDRPRHVDRHRVGRHGHGAGQPRRARPRDGRRAVPVGWWTGRRAHDGVHDPGARPAVQRVQRPLRPGQRVPPAVHQPLAVGRDRAVVGAAGRGGGARLAQRRLRHDPAHGGAVGDLRRTRERRPVGRRGQEAGRAPLARPVGT
jgi:hypothetical protein